MLLTKSRANPHKIYNEDPWEKDHIRRRGNIPQVPSRYKEKFASVDPEGEDMDYQHEPVSAFQARCRRQEPKKLQHFTRCLKDEIVERVCNISLGPNGNHHGTLALTLTNPIVHRFPGKIGRIDRLFGTTRRWTRVLQVDECSIRTV